MAKDDEYKEMELAEKRAKKILKDNNYRCQKLECCATCDNSCQGYPEESRACDLAYQEGWTFGEVSDFGICDKYEAGE